MRTKEPFFTATHQEWMLKNYQNYSAPAAAKILGMSVSSVKKLKKILGLDGCAPREFKIPVGFAEWLNANQNATSVQAGRTFGIPKSSAYNYIKKLRAASLDSPGVAKSASKTKNTPPAARLESKSPVKKTTVGNVTRVSGFRYK